VTAIASIILGLAATTATAANIEYCIVAGQPEWIKVPEAAFVDGTATLYINAQAGSGAVVYLSQGF